jgi:tetratricopeptide (TPR) repeat protein
MVCDLGPDQNFAKKSQYRLNQTRHPIFCDKYFFDTQDHSSYTSIVKTEIIIKNKDIADNKRTEKHSHLVISLVLIITALVFSGSLMLEWTNWDDDMYVYNNPIVQKGKLKDIVMPPADPAKYNTYSPLVISSFALEWKLVKDRPFLYHFDNLILHLFCTALVWMFFRSMGLSVWWGCFAALLFGIHPMRVESVAWITERKDLLYTLFYMASLLVYIRYIASGKTGQLLLAFVFFALSLYSKVQAITLPFVLISLDWYFKRQIGFKVVIEKLLFFGVSLIIGIGISTGVNFLFRKADFITYSKIMDFIKQILLGGYAYTVYILKLFFPYVTSVLYPPPSSLHIEHWAGAAIAVVILISALAVWRKYRFITFGVMFFTLNVFLLPFASAVGDSTFLNDRYTYVAYIGLFFIVAMAMQRLTDRFPSYRILAACIAVIIILVFSALTIKYIPVWKNSGTLWTDVIEKYPRKIPMAYLNRGHYLYTNNQSGKALDDFNTAIELNPENPIAYLNRIFIYLERNNNEKALQDYNSYIELFPPCDNSENVLNPLLSDALGNRGAIYSKMGQYKKALVDFDLAIKLNPQNLNNYLNRAFAYMQLREYDKSIRDFNVCHQADPADPEIINNRGVCYFRSGDFKSALDDFNNAIKINSGNPSYYRNRAYAYHHLGRDNYARMDVLTAEKMGATTDPAFRKLLQLR